MSSSSRSTIIVGGLVAITAALLAACGGGADTSCVNVFVPGTIVGVPSINVSLTNTFGTGVAFGTTVTATTGTDSLPGRAIDTLHIDLGTNRSGTFTVHISRPFYRDTSIANVQVVPGRDCGSVVTTHLPVTLPLAPGAPAVRAVDVIGTQFLGTPGSSVRLTAHFDADPTASRAVLWRVSDTTLASVDSTGLVTAKCTTHGGTDTVTAISRTDTLRRGSALVGIGMAASCP
jgi:hypothetical protein